MAKDPTDIRMPSMLDRLNGEPKAWDTREPDCPNPLICMLLERSQFSSDYGPYVVYEAVDAEEQIWTIHAFHTSLANQLEDFDMGTIVGIKVGEKTVTRSGRDIVPYKVVSMATNTKPPAKDTYEEEPF